MELILGKKLSSNKMVNQPLETVVEVFHHINDITNNLIQIKMDIQLLINIIMGRKKDISPSRYQK